MDGELLCCCCCVSFEATCSLSRSTLPLQKPIFESHIRIYHQPVSVGSNNIDQSESVWINGKPIITCEMKIALLIGREDFEPVRNRIRSNGQQNHHGKSSVIIVPFRRWKSRHVLSTHGHGHSFKRIIEMLVLLPFMIFLWMSSRWMTSSSSSSISIHINAWY